MQLILFFKTLRSDYLIFIILSNYFFVYINKEVLLKKNLHMNNNRIYLHCYCNNNINLHTFRLIDVGNF